MAVLQEQVLLVALVEVLLVPFWLITTISLELIVSMVLSLTLPQLSQE